MKRNNPRHCERSVAIQVLMLVLFLLLSLNCFAQSPPDRYPFNTAAQEAEFNELTQNLRCLICAGQSINDSNTPFSDSVKDRLHQWILTGKSHQEILDQLNIQYGDAIFFQPPMKASTYFLWFGPFIFFILGVALLVRKIIKSSTTKK